MPIPECETSQNLQFIAQECEAKKFLDRINKVEQAFCEIDRRIEVAHSKIIRDCVNPPSSSSGEEPSSSSSSSLCRLRCQPEKKEQIAYLIKVETLNATAWEALELLEDEVCETLRQLVELEVLVEQGCVVASSSSQSSSSSVPPSSSSSSSVVASSSSSLAPPSSSSSSSVNCLTSNLLMIGSYCPSLPNYSINLIPDESPNLELYGPCYWVSPDAPPPDPSPERMVSLAEPVAYSDGTGVNDSLNPTPTPLYATGVTVSGEMVYSSTGVYEPDPYSATAPFIQLQKLGPQLYLVGVGTGGYSEFYNTDTAFPIGTPWTAYNLEGPNDVLLSVTDASTSSSSSSVAPAIDTQLRYNLSLNRWEYVSGVTVIAYRFTFNQNNPTGNYTYVDAPCVAYNIILISEA